MKKEKMAIMYYAGIFIISFSTLAIQITLTRLLSVITWYCLVFFAVSTAMLGMTAGSVTVYLKSEKFSRDHIELSLTKACLAFSLAVPLSIFLICTIPLKVEFSFMQIVALLLVTIACSIPFYFSGIVISAVLTKVELSINKLYASDLFGAAFGCLFTLVGLELMDAPSLIIFTGAMGVPAALLFGKNKITRKMLISGSVIFFILIGLSLVNRFTLNGIRPILVKGEFEDINQIYYERWNSHTRITVEKCKKTLPQYWGGSPVAPRHKTFHQYKMTIDGGAATTMRKFSRIDDIKDLKYDLTNIAYFLRSKGSACIIGIGGGRDIQSAILFGHQSVVGIDINPIFVDLLKGRFRKFAGITDHPSVKLEVDEARSYLSQSREQFNVIQMSLIDTWASTAAGAYSLSENSLYTIEAWKIFLSRLNPSGVFTISRWYNPDNLGETGRVVSLATATLLDHNVPDPQRHIFMVTGDRISTLILSLQPFSEMDQQVMKNTVENLKFRLVIAPDIDPEHDVLKRILHSKTRKQITERIAAEALNYTPPTDETPYFFNMLKVKSLFNINKLSRGVISGNLTASLMLVVLILCLLVLTVFTIVIPLLFNRSRLQVSKSEKRSILAGAFYFSMIGFGFMFIEIGLIQRLSVYLGHPVYALAILLFSLILSTGCGSLLSQKLPSNKLTILPFLSGITLLVIILLNLSLSSIIGVTITYKVLVKAIIAIIIIFPTGICLGMFFPTGMRLAKMSISAETPWFWALNGICGVLGSALAVFISIYIGISFNFIVAALLYLLLIFPGLAMSKAYSAKGT